MMDAISLSQTPWITRGEKTDTNPIPTREDSQHLAPAQDDAEADIPPLTPPKIDFQDYTIDAETLISRATSEAEQDAGPFQQNASTEESQERPAAKSTTETSAKTTPSQPEEKDLSKDEQEQVREMEQRDAEVRRHEQAHLAAGGQYVRGGAKLEFETGPNNRQYAVGGEVSIDTSEGRTPEETVQKAAVVRKAALAPANPSPQDRSVAAKAGSMAAAARKEILSQQTEHLQEPQDLDRADNAADAQNAGSSSNNKTLEPIGEGPGTPKSADRTPGDGLNSIRRQARTTQGKQAYESTTESASGEGGIGASWSPQGGYGAMGPISSLSMQI